MQNPFSEKETKILNLMLEKFLSKDYATFKELAYSINEKGLPDNIIEAYVKVSDFDEKMSDLTQMLKLGEKVVGMYQKHVTSTLAPLLKTKSVAVLEDTFTKEYISK